MTHLQLHFRYYRLDEEREDDLPFLPLRLGDFGRGLGFGFGLTSRCYTQNDKIAHFA